MKATIYLEKISKEMTRPDKKRKFKRNGGLGADGEIVVGRGYWRNGKYYKATDVVFEGNESDILVDLGTIERLSLYAENLNEFKKHRPRHQQDEIEKEIFRVQQFITKYIQK